jgi:uncharacterized membrane protein YbaN (DUF454 family)
MTTKKAMLGGSLSMKIVACALVLAFVVIGALGLVLPIIPGLLFLAIAAFIAAKHFPWVDTRLRSHRTIGRHLHNADRFRDLSFSKQVQIAGWLCAKMFLEGVAFVRSFVTKLGAASRNGWK